MTRLAICSILFRRCAISLAACAISLASEKAENCFLNLLRCEIKAFTICRFTSSLLLVCEGITFELHKLTLIILKVLNILFCKIKGCVMQRS